MLERVKRFREKLTNGEVPERPPMMQAMQDALVAGIKAKLAEYVVRTNPSGHIGVKTVGISVDDLSELVFVTTVSFTNITFKDGGKSVGYKRRLADKDREIINIQEKF